MRAGIAAIALFLAFQAQAEPPTYLVGKYHAQLPNLKKAAQLAAKNPSCKAVLFGLYIPPAEQQQPGRDYLITCQAPSKPSGTLDLYISRADLKASRTPNAPHALPREKAAQACRTALAARYGTQDGVRYTLTGISDNGSANRRVDFTIHAPGANVRAYCIVDPAGKTESHLILN